MKRFGALSALMIAAIAGTGAPSFAYDGGHTKTDQEPGTSRVPTPEQRSEIPSSDATRIVGQVIQMDRELGMVALATDEGMLLVQAPPHALRSIDVGDFVAVPRSVAQGPNGSGDRDSPSAMPRMEPPGPSPNSPSPYMGPSAPSTDRL